jgi:hypothetical protein
MRKRGLIFILAAAPAWIFFTHFEIEARKSPFGYELGSAVFPFPPSVRAAGMFALVVTFLGLCVLALDFDRWIRKRRSE